jgi:hypothetical protein
MSLALQRQNWDKRLFNKLKWLFIFANQSVQIYTIQNRADQDFLDFQANTNSLNL